MRREVQGDNRGIPTNDRRDGGGERMDFRLPPAGMTTTDEFLPHLSFLFGMKPLTKGRNMSGLHFLGTWPATLSDGSAHAKPGRTQKKELRLLAQLSCHRPLHPLP